MVRRDPYESQAKTNIRQIIINALTPEIKALNPGINVIVVSDQEHAIIMEALRAQKDRGLLPPAPRL